MTPILTPTTDIADTGETLYCTHSVYMYRSDGSQRETDSNVDTPADVTNTGEMPCCMRIVHRDGSDGSHASYSRRDRVVILNEERASTTRTHGNPPCAATFLLLLTLLLDALLCTYDYSSKIFPQQSTSKSFKS